MEPYSWPKLNVTVAPDAGSVAKRGAEIVVEQLRQNPGLLFCASAGASPTGLYRELAQKAAVEPSLFKQMRVVKVDEWGGLRMDNLATCEVDLTAKLLVPLRVGADRYEGFRSDAPDPQLECRRLTEWLSRHGPIDLCVLGLGANGHVAMNEPSEALCPHAHVAQLAVTSLQHPMLKANSAKPDYGLTLGMGDIMSARKILLPVLGTHKQEVLKKLLTPAISTFFPASFLWLHPDVTVLCDEEAAGTGQ
jgi:galactosamine-6-phosphate isomerase